LARAGTKLLPLVVLATILLVLPPLGVAMVKPCVVGTTARASKENVRSIGYSIYYTLVNIGGALGPWLAGLINEHLPTAIVFRMAALSVFLMFFVVLVFFKEPQRSGETNTASIAETLRNFVKSSQSQIHGIFADFFRLLDRLLAGIHLSAALCPRLHQSRTNTDRMLSTGPLVVIALTVAMSVATKKMAPFSAVILGTVISMIAFTILAIHSSVIAVYATLVVVALGEIIQAPRCKSRRRIPSASGPSRAQASARVFSDSRRSRRPSLRCANSRRAAFRRIRRGIPRIRRHPRCADDFAHVVLFAGVARKDSVDFFRRKDGSRALV